MSAGWPAPPTASAYNQLDEYASSPGNRAYCYAELAVSSLAVVKTIASTHCTYPVNPRRDGQSVGLVTYRGGMPSRRRSPVPVLTGLNVK